MKKPIAGIINISINNILSIKRALEFIGFDTVLINEHVPIEKFDLIVLPGVGAFNEAMNTLNKTNLLKTIDQALNKNKKFLGICLGMQLLFQESDEFIKTKGIGFFNGKVESFKSFPIHKKTFIEVQIKHNNRQWGNTTAFTLRNILNVARSIIIIFLNQISYVMKKFLK